MTDKQFAVECAEEFASTFKGWLDGRGGLAAWKSIYLADPGAGCTTPALDDEGKPYPKPHWKYGNTPEVITDENQVGVLIEVLFKEVRVALRISSNGLTLKLTEGSQRKLEKALAKCRELHGNAHYRKGDMFDRCIRVYYTSAVVPLPEYLKSKGDTP